MTSHRSAIHTNPHLCFLMLSVIDSTPHLFHTLMASTHPTPHHNRYMALFRDHPGQPVPEENFWTLWCNRGRHTTIRLCATPSGLTSAHLHHPAIFFKGRMPFLLPNQQCQSTWWLLHRFKIILLNDRCTMVWTTWWLKCHALIRNQTYNLCEAGSPTAVNQISNWHHSQ